MTTLCDTFRFADAYLEIWYKGVPVPLLITCPVLRFVSVPERPDVRSSKPAIANPLVNLT